MSKSTSSGTRNFVDLGPDLQGVYLMNEQGTGEKTLDCIIPRDEAIFRLKYTPGMSEQ